MKAIVIRERLILWHMSVTWEFVEMSLSYKLPNFAECWWDHWVMDVLVCNGVGIEVGIWMCRYLEVKEYKWLSVFDHPTFFGKLNRTILQFTPESWIRVEWNCFKSTRRYLEIHYLMIAFQLIDLNSFFLKRLLWVPTKHYMNACRLLLLCTLGLVVIRQYYVLISHPTYDRIGLHSWLFYLILITEMLVIFKLSKNEFTEPMPKDVRMGLWIGCSLYIIVSAAGLLYISACRCTSSSKNGGGDAGESKKAR
uniref:L-serine-phosphatidylethanolamine phosphatidyltransferase n=1 Tax=Lotharella oceanica TaxID=641309 RepID=A0A7S2TVZ1_9EUKA